MQQYLLTLTILASLLTTLVASQCESSYWPIYAGGSSGDEDVRCFVYDPKEQLIIVGGVTKSNDFSPQSIDHGYLFALDLSANWKWGNFFYNISYPISQIDGCQFSSDGDSLAIAGLANNQPIMMDIKTKDGTINQFISLDFIVDNPSSTLPVYQNYGAIYYDKRDYRDY